MDLESYYSFFEDGVSPKGPRLELSGALAGQTPRTRGARMFVFGGLLP